MKKLASILLSVLMLTSVIAGASAETFTGDDNGIGPVTVALTVEDGKITEAVVTGDSETPGSAALKPARTAPLPRRSWRRRAPASTASPARP